MLRPVLSTPADPKPLTIHPKHIGGPLLRAGADEDAWPCSVRCQRLISASLETGVGFRVQDSGFRVWA